MKFKIATKLTSLLRGALNLFNSKGTALPGNLLLRFYPGFLRDSTQFTKDNNGKNFSVTGTNGKSTTSSILAMILEKNGKRVIHNTEGANMPAGIATTIAVGLDKFNKADNLVIETDEAYIVQVFKEIDFDYLILTNLFEDQMDRHGSPLELRRKIQAAIDLNPNIKVITNADDPIFNEIRGEKIYFGLNSVSYLDAQGRPLKNVKSEPKKTHICPKCGTALKYSKVFYSKIGRYYCTCGLIRPVLDYSCTVKIFEEHSELKITNGKKIYKFKIELKGLYNAYNALAAVVAALEYGLKEQEIQKGLDCFTPLYGRSYTAQVDGRDINLNLIKNAVGANEIIKSFGNLEWAKILIAINNDYPDGRDFSWIYKTDFELLNTPNNQFFITGSKAAEMAQRLKDAGVDTKNIKVEPNLKKAVRLGLNALDEDEELIALMVFTALKEFEKKF